MLKILLLILFLTNYCFAAVSGKQAITDTATLGSLNSFVTNLADSNVAWTLKKSRPLTSNLVIPITQKFSIAKGVKLDLAGYTLTIKSGGEFGDSCIVGSSGTVVFDTCSVLEFHTSWIGSSSVVCHWRGCNRDTSKVTKFQAGTAGIGSLATTIHINDSTNARTERLIGKSYAQGGYNGDLTGTSQFADSCKGGAVRANTATTATTASRADSCTGGSVRANTATTATTASRADSCTGGSVRANTATTATTASRADSCTGGASRSNTAKTATTATTATNLSGGYVIGTTGTFSGNLSSPNSFLTNVTSTVQTVDSSKHRVVNATEIYLGGKPVYELSIVNNDNVALNEEYVWALCPSIGWIFGSEETGLAIYDNNIVSRKDDFQIVQNAGDMTVDVSGVTNIYSNSNLNLESVNGDVNLSSSQGDINISTSTVKIYCDFLMLNMPEIYFNNSYISGISTIDNLKTIRTQKLALKVDTLEIRNESGYDSLILFMSKLNFGGDLYQLWGTSHLNAVDALNASINKLNYSVGVMNNRSESGVMSTPNYINCADTSFFALENDGTYAFGGCIQGKSIIVRNNSSAVACSLRAINTDNSRNFLLPAYKTALMTCYYASNGTYIWSVWISDY